MLFTQNLRKELYATASAVLITLLTVLLTVSLVRILGQAAAGRADPSAILLLIALGALNGLPILLSLTVFIAVLMVIGRLYRDSEMNVWFSSGLSLSSFIVAAFRFAVPFAILIALFALFVSPWASRQVIELRARFEQRDDISRVAPGRFIESSSAERVFFVDSFDEKQRTVTNVFAVLREPVSREGQVGEKTTVLIARDGHVDVRDGERYVTLDAGRRYEDSAGVTPYSVMEFDRYALRLGPRTANLQSLSTEKRVMSAQQLLADRSSGAQGELVNRFGTAFMLLNLALLAVPLAFTNPRAGRSANLIFALLLYVVYNNLLSFAQTQVTAGKWSFLVGLFAIHLGVLAVTLFLWWRAQSTARPNPLSIRTWRVWLGVA